LPTGSRFYDQREAADDRHAAIPHGPPMITTPATSIATAMATQYPTR
jgi:hypothetical protein